MADPFATWRSAHRSSCIRRHDSTVAGQNSSGTTSTSASCSGDTDPGMMAQGARAAMGINPPIPETAASWAITTTTTPEAIPAKSPRPRVAA